MQGMKVRLRCPLILILSLLTAGVSIRNIRNRFKTMLSSFKSFLEKRLLNIIVVRSRWLTSQGVVVGKGYIWISTGCKLRGAFT